MRPILGKEINNTGSANPQKLGGGVTRYPPWNEASKQKPLKIDAWVFHDFPFWETLPIFRCELLLVSGVRVVKKIVVIEALSPRHRQDCGIFVVWGSQHEPVDWGPGAIIPPIWKYARRAIMGPLNGGGNENSKWNNHIIMQRTISGLPPVKCRVYRLPLSPREGRVATTCCKKKILQIQKSLSNLK